MKSKQCRQLGFMTGISVFCSVFSLSAYADSNFSKFLSEAFSKHDSAGNLFVAKGAETGVEVLKCARKIFANSIGGTRGAVAATKYIDLAQRYVHEKAAEEAILKECEKFRSSSRPMPTKEDEIFQAVDHRNDVSAKAREVAHLMIHPTVVCRKVGIGADFAGGSGLSLHQEVGFCQASNGRRWVESSPGASFNVGLGVAATVNCYTEKREQNSDLIQGTGDLKVVEGLLVVVNRTAPVDDEPRTQGVGVGAGLIVKMEGSLNVQNIPLPMNKNYLARLLQAKETDLEVFNRDDLLWDGSTPCVQSLVTGKAFRDTGRMQPQEATSQSDAARAGILK